MRIRNFMRRPEMARNAKYTRSWVAVPQFLQTGYWKELEVEACLTLIHHLFGYESAHKACKVFLKAIASINQ